MRIINFEMDGDTLVFAPMSWRQMENYIKSLRELPQNQNVDASEERLLQTIVDGVKRANPNATVTTDELRDQHDLAFLNAAYEKLTYESGIRPVRSGEAKAAAAA